MHAVVRSHIVAAAACGAAVYGAALAAAAPVAAQSTAPPTAARDTVARPAPIPKRGAVPREPAVEQKLRTDVKAPDGFNVTLFAGPPVAMYPTCVGESPDGAVFVGVDPNLSLSVTKGVGRLMRLVDDDHDGRADRYTTFAEMDSPRGVVSDGRTVYVMHPPTLTAYRDTNGDGIADEAHDLVQGLGFNLDFRGADHTTNNVELGIDGWLYVAVGDYGFIKAVGADGTQIQHRGGAVVRVRPDGTGLEVYATGTRNIYDVALDPFMNVYARDNTNDGDGWDSRLHYVPAGANMGYPMLYQNFATEHFPSLHDYGAGAAVGSLWVQDPALPSGYNNTLYTGDWTLNKIFRNPLTPKGSIFDVQQEEFLSVAHPSDLILDGRSNLYVASLDGGVFTYSADTVGYVFRVSYAGGAAAGKAQPAAEPRLATLNDAQLLARLASGNAVHRLHAQQELLRRGAKGGTVGGLQRMIADARQPAEARAAAMFTLKQLVGAQAHAALQPIAADPDARLRVVALRTLVDRKDQLAGVPAALYVRALADGDAHVQTQGIYGLVRLGARDAADAIVPLAGSADQGLSHLAVHALAALGARDAALKGVDAGPPAVRAGALRALALMHDGATVGALVDRLGRAPDAESRGALLHTLGRLYNREGYWAGDWWTTRPAHLGPYFDPAAWEASPQIRVALTQALAAASSDEFAALARDFALNQVVPRGAAPLLVAASNARDPRRVPLIAAMVGRTQLDADGAAVAAQMDAASPALHTAVAQLLAGETTFGVGTIPLARTTVLDPKLDPALRGQLLTVISQVPGPAGLDAAAEVFSRLNPVPGLPAAATPAAAAAAGPTPPAGQGAGTGTPTGTATAARPAGNGTATGTGNGSTAAAVAAGTTGPGAAGGAQGATSPVEVAWRRFVGERRRAEDLDYFINLARTGQPAQRTLAYAVLVQSIRSPRAPAPVRDKVKPVIDAAWSDPASTSSLVQAITLMRLEGQYTEQLQAHGRPAGQR